MKTETETEIFSQILISQSVVTKELIKTMELAEDLRTTRLNDASNIIQSWTIITIIANSDN